MSRIVIELELTNGAELFSRKPGVEEAETLAKQWIGHYLDAAGDQMWWEYLSCRGAEVPDGAGTGQLRIVEVMPDGRRLTRWDWKGKPQVPEIEEAPVTDAKREE